MVSYEYKVVPAPTKGRKGKGVKGPEGRFAQALQEQMNQLAELGWEFLRAETLPSEERSGLTSSTTTYRSVMVFRRPRADDASAFAPRTLEKPSLVELPAPAATPAPSEPSPEASDASTDETPQMPDEDETADTPDTSAPGESDGKEEIPAALQARVKSLRAD